MNEIKCINKQERDNPRDRITHLGGVNSQGGYRKLTQKEVIEKIKSKNYQFFVMKAGSKVKVVVATSRFGNDYVKTESDWESPNNLLSLMECK